MGAELNLGGNLHGYSQQRSFVNRGTGQRLTYFAFLVAVLGIVNSTGCVSKKDFERYRAEQAQKQLQLEQKQSELQERDSQLEAQVKSLTGELGELSGTVQQNRITLDKRLTELTQQVSKNQLVLNRLTQARPIFGTNEFLEDMGRDGKFCGIDGNWWKRYTAIDSFYQSTLTSTDPPKYYLLISNPDKDCKLGENGIGFRGKWATGKIRGVGNWGGLMLGDSFKPDLVGCTNGYYIRGQPNAEYVKLYSVVGGVPKELATTSFIWSERFTNFEFYKQDGRIIYKFDGKTIFDIPNNDVNITPKTQFGAWGYEDAANTSWHRLADVSVINNTRQ